VFWARASSISSTSARAVAVHMASRVGDKRKCDASEALSDIAGSFRCSITSSLVLDPVTTCDGQLYEQTAIQEWLQTHSTSPNTGSRLASKTLTPSPAVKTAVERLVLSGCLEPEEMREWMLRKALKLLDLGEAAEAQPLLERALAEGEAAASYHLGRLLIDRAATAGVPDAIATVAKLGLQQGDQQPISSLDDVSVGETVRVLPEAQAAAAVEAHNASRPRGGARLNFPPKRVLCGQEVKVLVKDSSDKTIKVSHRLGQAGASWFPIGALGRRA